MLLQVQNLNVDYGGIKALQDVSIEVAEGHIVALIGANGAGKSSLLKAICGVVKPRSGSIEMNGQSILGKPSHELVWKGIAMVPEGRRIFPGLTVMDNLRCGAYTQSDQPKIAQTLDLVFELFPVLQERVKQKAGLLSGGEQQMLAISRALMSDPKVVLMDEPSLGLSPMLVQQVFNIIQDIHARGRTILLAEQNARAALKLSEYVYVLETGRVVLQGSAQELAGRDDIRKAYLGVA